MPTEVKEIFEATSRSVAELLCETGLGFYIPAYQRPYSWDKAKVNKLLDDTLNGLNVLVKTEDSFTFLGSIITIHDIKNVTVHPIVKEMVPGKVLTVIDGQQRLCSLVILCIALHSQITVKHHDMAKGGVDEDSPEAWLSEQTQIRLQSLSSTFCEKQATGESPFYPRIIRAFTDQWSRKASQAKYESPIANLISSYLVHRDLAGRPKDFRPTARKAEADTDELAGESALTKRYNEIRASLSELARGEEGEELEGLPDLKDFALAPAMQKALFGHEFSNSVLEELQSPTNSTFAPLLRMVMLAGYVLNRIALTVVRGKNEDYAFTIFESLNTTGEPLTAFETFKPRVVRAETLELYGDSKSRIDIELVEQYLSQFGVGTALQNATRDLLVYFAEAETGSKLSKRLSDQRAYLRQQFDRHADDPSARLEFLDALRDTTQFVDLAWNQTSGRVPELKNLPLSASSDSIRLCLAFLRSLNHSVTIGPMVRFYSYARQGDVTQQLERVKNLEAAIKAITAFSVLWRTSRRSTANIDREYRAIMAGDNLTFLSGPLARQAQKVSTAQPCLPDAHALKAELRGRLSKIGVADRDSWISMSKVLPLYDINTQLCRFLLLAAYDDSVPDGSTGLIVRGKSGISSCLNYTSYEDDRFLTLEHVAPQKGGSTWASDLYSDADAIGRLGNLVLAQQQVNSSLSNRPWKEKRTLYAALSAATQDLARMTLAASGEDLSFAGSTEALVADSRHMPHLAAVGSRSGDWDLGFITERSTRLLELAWDKVYPWLAE